MKVLYLTSVISIIVLSAAAFLTVDAWGHSNQTENPFLYGNDPMSSLYIKGNFSEPENGIEMKLPDGWTGLRMGFMGAMISPGDSPFPSQQTNATIIITILNASDLARGAKMAANLTQLQHGDKNAILDPKPSSDFSCTDKQSFTVLNGMTVMHAVSECKDSNSAAGYTSSNIYNVATDKKLISVGLTSNSAEASAKYGDDFERSIKTLRVNGAIDYRSFWPNLLGLATERHSIETKGNMIDVDIQSNSKITEFAFNENQKSLSLTVSGENGTAGYTFIPIGRFLQGPYVVMVDGIERTRDCKTINDETGDGASSTIQLSYHHSSHQIVITGTNVVPEFPTAIVGFFFSGFAAIIIGINRLSLLHSKT